MAHDDRDVKKSLRALLDRARQHLNDGAEARRLAMSYYDGKMPDIDPREAEKDRTTSKIVSMDVRATIRKLMPAVMRTMFSSDKFVEYVAQGPEDVPNAEAATQYVNKVLMKRCGAKDAIHDAIHDAMLLKTGVLHAYVVRERRTKVCDYSGQPGEVLAQAQAMKEVTDVEQADDGTYSFSTVETGDDLQVRLEAVPREQFLIDPRAEDVASSPIVGHVRHMSRSDLVALGYDRRLVYRASGYRVGQDSEFSDAFERRGDDWSDDGSSDDMNRSQETVLVYFAYVKLDLDDDGVSELHRFVLVEGPLTDGDLDDVATTTSRRTEDYIVLEQELVNEAPYFPVVIEREPHSFEGHSIAEETMEVQRVKTSLTRESLNNLYAVNMPQMFIDVSKVDDDEPLFNRQFNVPVTLRNAAKAADVVNFSEVPYVADKNLDFMTHVDKMVKEATGITDASGGADPNRMEHMAATTASILSDAAVSQSEMMVRTLKMGGIRDAFSHVYRLVVNHAQPEAAVVDGASIQFTPSEWPTEMECVVNTGLGTGARERELNNLMMIQETMKFLMESGQPLFMNEVTTIKYLTKLVETIGYTDVSQFFHTPTEEEIEAHRAEPPMEVKLKKMEIDAEMEGKAAELDLDAQKMEMESAHQAQMDQMKAQMDAALKESEAQSKVKIEEAQLRADLRVESAKAQNQWQIDQLKEINKAQIENMRVENAKELKAMELLFEKEMKEMEMKHEREMKKLELEQARLEAERDRESQEKMAREGNESKEAIAEGKNDDG